MEEIPEEEPFLPDVLFNADIGVIKEIPGVNYVVAFRDGLESFHRKRQLYNLKQFFDYLEGLNSDEEAWESFRKKVDAQDEDLKGDFSEILFSFLNTRDAKAKLEALARMFKAVVEEQLSVEVFYDLTHILVTLNARSLQFLASMGRDGFEAAGDIQALTDDGAILIGAGICIREPNKLTITPLGRKLYAYIDK